MSPKKQTAVIALGGNAITKKGVPDTIANQFANTRQSLSGIIPLIKNGYNIAITHGNGPQVGNALLRVELARNKAPILPLGICVADTEGGMGYMIEQSLQNRLRSESIKRDVVTIVTQVIVDKDDPSIKNPSKFVGQFYDYNTARKFARERGWQVKKDSDRGWRRVVASPIPIEIVEAKQIKILVDKRVVVIAAGGGGIPIYIEENGDFEGVDAVIDKDRASAVLAKSIGAELLLILTGVDNVALNFGKLDQKLLGEVNYKEMKKYLDQGHFPPGSMGPKVEAALGFLEMGGKKVIITSIENAYEAVMGNAGTIITM
ncbi:MAG: carbamate kinase [candidate division Zixibacteria bacterium]|nr:carbamate kinase [candidate division Zixibacteria bacterium]NIR67848.1 carbamate kinase [candidate division Zixibacteria bacterium]NIS15544.1 carbamate kinase [candidate division Zixibacteria bacterium]NIS49074.1 carbamate kinase [candidate division Zixibacteria bacterium]NIT52069.1 carbamate kinase [candidate division Zixibacteria bacterium]